MADWSRFLPYLLPHVAGVAEPAAEQALREAAGLFLKKTRAWREWLAEISAVDGQRTYALALPAGAQVVQIEKATANGADISTLAWSGFQADPALYPPNEAGVASRDRVSITLGQAWPAGTKIQVQVSLTCTEDATGVADALFVQHRKAIVDGAKADLMLKPGATYSDPDRAAVARADFQAAIDEEAARVYRSHSNNMPRRRPAWC